ncbi:hypothetical protein PISMIDRAFT_201796 [Pisolithus microcarpus 441]|uniref:Unplaced genomic scaffold scaffold_13, whole genome shotgun sequence n=1 Tax=Pisolithus microcarpus 441 TaxID=765257 RepID=A0A0C9YQ73_9AGAM|nr:hypothetical protein PISMIDRAFT_201796 [Pisolithus microcarpus 441]
MSKVFSNTLPYRDTRLGNGLSQYCSPYEGNFCSWARGCSGIRRHFGINDATAWPAAIQCEPRSSQHSEVSRDKPWVRAPTRQVYQTVVFMHIAALFNQACKFYR